MYPIAKVIGPLSSPELASFESKFTTGAPDECWLWQAGTDGNGYGSFWLRGGNFAAHRVALTVARGALDPFRVIDHLCRNRACVNPDHLEETTVQCNTARGIGPTAAAATARLVGRCVNGHDIGAVGLHKQGAVLTCGKCGRDRVARYRAKKRAAQLVAA
jgi:hypothetical protein